MEIKNIEELRPTKLYKYYWEFAFERQQIFLLRLEDNTAKSNNPILAKYKFTNTYRVLDRVSQYLVKEIINNDINYTDKDLLFRILLFKFFNKIETWENLKQMLGDIKYSNFNIVTYKNAFANMLERNQKVYSAAYIMPAKTKKYNSKIKYENHLQLLKDIMEDNAAQKIANMKSMEEVYVYLRSFDLIGRFLAFQYAIDINYSRLTSFDENEFVVAGPGAIRGINKAFENAKNFTAEEITKFLTVNQIEESKRMGHPVINILNRKLKLIDVQNIFCEFDKYTRERDKTVINNTTRKRIKQLHKPKNNKIKYVFPNKWGEVKCK